MEERGVSPQTKRSLGILGQLEDVKQFYLAGGTACALYFGHRISYDLDFFSDKKFNSKNLSDKFRKLGSLEISTLGENTFLGLFDDVKISFFYYPYPLIGEIAKFKNINIASKKDLAAMKIDAIKSRGTKRDFVDLYFIMQKENYSIDLVLQFYDERYGVLKSNQPHILKSLIYFQDAEAGDEPHMLVSWNWQKIKKFFIDEIVRFEKKNLGI